MSTGPRFIPGRSARRLSESCAICEARSGSFIASLISWPSCSRCSGDSDAIIRSAAACRRASASISSSTFSGFSGNRSPCLSMNSLNRSVVSSPRACAASRSFRSASMSLTACIAAGSGSSSACFSPANCASSTSRCSICWIDSYVARASSECQSYGASARTAPAVSSGSGGQLHLRPARVVAVLGGELVALLGEGLVERRADLVERAAEVTAAPGGVAHPADLARRGRRAPGCRRSPRRSRSDSASRSDPPASTSRPTASSAARTSYGGASGSGPSVQGP